MAPHAFPKSLIGLACTIGLVHGLGINCRGSSQCGIPGKCDGIGPKLDLIYNAESQGVQNTRYTSGQHILCPADGSCCVFFQNGASGTLEDVKNYLHQLEDHGCTGCGSVPTNGDDVSNGELTINYVSDPSCHNGALDNIVGVCAP